MNKRVYLRLHSRVQFRLHLSCTWGWTCLYDYQRRNVHKKFSVNRGPDAALEGGPDGGVNVALKAAP